MEINVVSAVVALPTLMAVHFLCQFDVAVMVTIEP
jgi:hypothetical protein